MFKAEILADVVRGVAERLSPLLTEGSGVVMDSVQAGGLDGVAAEGGGWLEDEDVVVSSVLLSGGVRGGVGNPAEEVEDEGSLTALLSDGFLS